jgi:hypothetical protein
MEAYGKMVRMNSDEQVKQSEKLWNSRQGSLKPVKALLVTILYSTSKGVAKK